jgi:hypothetical protein
MRLSPELREELERRLHALAEERAHELPRVDTILLALIVCISAAAIFIIR